MWCTVFQQKVQYDDIYITEQKYRTNKSPLTITGSDPCACN